MRSIGYLWISLGFLVNEWILAYAFEIDAFGPVSRIFISVLNLGLVLWGVLTIRFKERPILINLNLSVMVFCITLIVIECALRAYPKILGQEFANGILTKYSTLPEGIYYKDPVLDIRMMVPNYKTQMYYNGYVWAHEADRLGFRNASVKEKADIVLLGDSLIYGHGVNADQTVSYYLEKYTGRTVVNMARQGDSSLQQAYLLTEYIGRFQPQYVFYCFYENDISDLYVYRTDTNLEDFVNTPLEKIAFAKRMSADAALVAKEEENYALSHTGSLYGQLCQRLYLFKIIAWIKSRQDQQARDLLSSDNIHDINDEQSLGWRYTKHAIEYMNSLARQHNSKFVIVPITPRNKKHFSILKQFARDQGIDFVDSLGVMHIGGVIVKHNQDTNRTSKSSITMRRNWVSVKAKI